MTKEKRMRILTAAAALIFILLIAFVYLNNCENNYFLQDDAYTTFRYVNNFINGNGLVYNAGERVEGYTSFLFVVLLSASGLTGFNLESSSQFLSLCFGLMMIFAVPFLYRSIRLMENKSREDKTIDSIFMIIPAVLMAFSTPIVYWGVSGMETTMFSFLIILLLIIALSKNNFGKPNYLFAAVAVICALTRPEGVVFFVIIILHRYFFGCFAQKGNANAGLFRKLSSAEIMEFAFFFIPVSVYIISRLVYYGYPLPNTYYAKTDHSIEFVLRGINYLTGFAAAFPIYIIVLLSPLWLIRYGKNLFADSLLYTIVVVYSLIIVIIGGDVLPIHRFFIPLLPLIYVLFSKSLLILFNFIGLNKSRLAKTIMVISLCAAVTYYSYFNYVENGSIMMEKRDYEKGLVIKMKDYAGFVNNFSRESGRNAAVALSTIGAFSYFSNAEIIDIVGLTDEYIAHNPKEVAGIDDELPVLWKERHYNADYVMNRKPDFIIFPAGAKPSAFAECAIFSHPEFIDNYYTQLFYSEKLNQLLPIFTNKKLIGIIESERENAGGNCDIRFLKHYINSADNFLKMLEENKESYFQKILSDCDSAMIYCSRQSAGANTMKGMAYFHRDSLREAKIFFTKAIKSDSLNSISFFYLKNILLQEKDTLSAFQVISRLNKISPYALGGIVNKF